MKARLSLSLLIALAVACYLGSVPAAPNNPTEKKGEENVPVKEDLTPGVRLTVYNDNYALVKDRRELPDALKAGVNLIQFKDVAATLDPTSVHFRSLTDPTAQVMEQNYEFDLVSADKLLQKYIDHKITAHTKDGKSYEGILLSFDAARLVLAVDRDKGPIYLVERGDNIKRIQFSSLPQGLLTRPTLVWELEARKASKHLVEVSYIANNIRWRADYNIVLNDDDTKVDVSGWVTVENNTGTTFTDAKVKLLAGVPQVDYNTVPYGFGPDYYKLIKTSAPTNRFGNDPSRAFGDHRVYDLPEKTTFNSSQIKQVELIKANSVPVVKSYVYDGAKLQWFRYGYYFDAAYGREVNKKVNVLVEIDNRAANNLGISLPKGKCRTYKKDTDGSLEFVGEDLIDHTARDEKVVLYTGDAFDIVGERKQTDFQRINDREYTEDFEIKVRNHKKEEVTVQVLEKMYRGGEWNLTRKSHDFEKLDARTITFLIKVAAGKEVTVTYQVHYKW